MSEQNYLTKKGAKKLRKELQEKKDKLDDLQKKLESAVEQGDISENAEYDSAMEEKVLTENRIGKIKNLLNNAEIIEPGQSGGKVQYGSTVKFKDDKDREYEYTLVGSGEVDRQDETMSFSSPIGKALKNQEKGDTVTVKAPKRDYKVEILEVK